MPVVPALPAVPGVAVPAVPATAVLPDQHVGAAPPAVGIDDVTALPAALAAFLLASTAVSATFDKLPLK